MRIVDTGVLVATADTTDPHHNARLDLLAQEPEPLVTTAMVIAEAADLLDRDLGPQAEAQLHTSITSGQLTVDAPTTPACSSFLRPGARSAVERGE